MLFYLLAVGAVAAWKYLPRPWHPTITLQTAHYTIYSSATAKQTQDTADAIALLYAAYSNRMGVLSTFNSTHARLKVRLFRDRDEFNRVNPNAGWAEAFYREPFCRAYFSADEINPYHWMLHESVHQLNHEVAHLKLEKWLEEGMATYFSTGRLEPGQLNVSNIDPNAYPVWWRDEIATEPDLAANIANGSVIPLRQIITNRGGPSLDTHVNLYYLHWWTLTRFLCDQPPYKDKALELIRGGGTLDSVERLFGPIDRLQVEWHRYVRELKSRIAAEEFRLSKDKGQFKEH
jgi:hypothetical protein